METTQNIIILILLIITVWLYLDRKDLKYWKNYYRKELDNSWLDRESLLNYSKKIVEEKEILSEMCFELEEKLKKAEEIISQQKQELLTRKTSKKK